MTWAEFHELFTSKYFLASARHVKAQEFLELKQGTMTVMEYVAKFTELARFADDYVATDMAKVRKFENRLKLSIRGKIVGLLLQDMDSMVRTTMAIEREIEDAWSIRDAGTNGKRKESNLLPIWESSQRLLVHEGPRDRAVTIKAKARPDQSFQLVRADYLLFLPSSYPYEK